MLYLLTPDEDFTVAPRPGNPTTRGDGLVQSTPDHRLLPMCPVSARGVSIGNISSDHTQQTKRFCGGKETADRKWAKSTHVT